MKFEPFSQMLDVVFNGRRAPGMPSDKPTVHVDDLVLRGTSHVRLKNGKIYKIVCTEVPDAKVVE